MAAKKASRKKKASKSKKATRTKKAAKTRKSASSTRAKSKPASKPRKLGSAQAIDICAGGTVTGDSISFDNHHGHDCTVTGLGDLVDCGDSFTVPAKSSKVCNILPGAQPGTYPYNADCCDKAANPVIIYQ